ncbi:hypothetical protein [Streptomyces sp. NPDC056549]|uniref:hypothetical protein n=1 Tax=Streptomyces sp. NPDC056549 TaxID=3345864 RepID=UPI0036A274B0
MTGRLFALAASWDVGRIDVMAIAPGKGKPISESPVVPASRLVVQGKLRVFTAQG